jgi:DNA-binding transcriptional LysR family regulator
MDMKNPETFCKVAETENLPRAGETVSRPQPTVSGHIASLEQTAGLRPLDLLGIQQVIVQRQKVLERDFFAVVAARRNLSPPARRFREFLHTQRS